MFSLNRADLQAGIGPKRRIGIDDQRRRSKCLESYLADLEVIGADRERGKTVKTFGIGFDCRLDSRQGIGGNHGGAGNDAPDLSVTTPEMLPVMLAELKADAKIMNASIAKTLTSMFTHS